MKKLLKNTFYVVTLAFSVVVATSCKESKKAEVSTNSFAGTWIAKEFIDDIITDKGIKTIDNGVTEIIVPEKVTDSVAFMNEDLERDKYLASIENDTLINHLYETKTQKAIIKNGNLILLPLDERYKAKEYIKADPALVKKAKEANVSAVRILINRTLSENKYAEVNSKKEVDFTEDGKITGLANFKNYYLSINGDSANIEDLTAINFTTAEGTDKSLGIEFQKDAVNLYDIVLLTKADEKPAYKKGKLLYALKTIK